MIGIVPVLCLLFLSVLMFSAWGWSLFAHTDTFRGRYTQRTCAGPCAQKSDGQCIRRGTGLDSCLRYPSYYYGHRYHYYQQRWF